MIMPRFEFILYVQSQERSRDFYISILHMQPTLDVPGITEFAILEGVFLGLMPENGIAKILVDTMPHPSTANGIPRCELYLESVNPTDDVTNAVLHGATLVSDVQARNWGDTVGYVADPDGHIIAFTRRTI